MQWYVYVGIAMLVILAVYIVIDIRTRKALKEKRAAERAEAKKTRSKKKKHKKK